MNRENYKSDTSKTVLVITTGFLVLHVVTKRDWAIHIALFIGIAGILSKAMAKWIHIVWMKLAWILSQVMPNILFTIIYFLVLTPIALLSRIFREDPLSLQNCSESLFVVRGKVFKKESFEKPW